MRSVLHENIGDLQMNTISHDNCKVGNSQKPSEGKSNFSPSNNFSRTAPRDSIIPAPTTVSALPVFSTVVTEATVPSMTDLSQVSFLCHSTG